MQQHVLVDGECIICRPAVARHQLVDGVCTCGCEPLDEDSAALLTALNELDEPIDAQRGAWNEAKHLRNPKGPGGGRFKSNVDKLKDAITAHKAGSGDGHPFDGYSREQLRRVAKARGIELGRGEDRDSIAKKLLDHLDDKPSVPVKPPLERKTTSTGKLQPHVSGDALRELDAKTRAAKRDLSPGQLKAVEQWTGGKGMVRKIQTGQVSDDTARNFDEALQKLPKVDGLVYRAVSSHGGSSQFAADLRPGQVLDLGAPVSTSIDPRQSGSFGTNLYEIESPAASYLAGVGSKFGYEKEAVLAPGRYEVVSSEYASIGLGKNNAKVLVVRLRDVTEGDRSWKPTTGTDFKLHEPEAKVPAKKAVPPMADKTLGKLTDEQVDNGIKMHGTETAKGKQLADEKRRRSEALAEKEPAVTTKVRADAIHAAPYLRESGGPARNGVDTKDIDSALTYYKGAGYLGINEDLRKGVKNGREQEDIDAIDAGMGPLTSDVEVYRGIRDPAKVFGDAWNDHDVTGLEWRDDAFVSTSGDGRSSNAAFSGANGAVMRIVAPKGTKAVGVTDYAEMELLLDRGLKYRVVKDAGVVDGRRRLDVEVIS